MLLIIKQNQKLDIFDRLINHNEDSYIDTYNSENFQLIIFIPKIQGDNEAYYPINIDVNHLGNIWVVSSITNSKWK